MRVSSPPCGEADHTKCGGGVPLRHGEKGHRATSPSLRDREETDVYFFPGGVVKGELLPTDTAGLGLSAFGLRTSLFLRT